MGTHENNDWSVDYSSPLDCDREWRAVGRLVCWVVVVHVELQPLAMTWSFHWIVHQHHHHHHQLVDPSVKSVGVRSFLWRHTATWQIIIDTETTERHDGRMSCRMWCHRIRFVTCKSSNHPLRSIEVLTRRRPSLARVKHTIAVPLLSSHWTAITSARFTC